MVVLMADSSAFQKIVDFWQATQEAQSLAQPAFIQGHTVCSWAITESWNACQVSCWEPAFAIIFSHPGRLQGNMTALGKSSQVHSAFSLRLLAKETVGVLGIDTPGCCFFLCSIWLRGATESVW